MEDMQGWVERYIERWGNPSKPKIENTFNKYIASNIVGDSILDVCCGIGHFCYYISKLQNVQYLGTDQNEYLLAKARNYFPLNNFKQADLFNLSSIDNADTVICLRTLGQDTWNRTYDYSKQCSYKDINNIDYTSALSQLLLKTNKRLLFTCPSERPERLKLILSILDSMKEKNYIKLIDMIDILDEISGNFKFTVVKVDK